MHTLSSQYCLYAQWNLDPSAGKKKYGEYLQNYGDETIDEWVLLINAVEYKIKSIKKNFWMLQLGYFFMNLQLPFD